MTNSSSSCLLSYRKPNCCWTLTDHLPQLIKCPWYSVPMLSASQYCWNGWAPGLHCVKEQTGNIGVQIGCSASTCDHMAQKWGAVTGKPSAWLHRSFVKGQNRWGAFAEYPNSSHSLQPIEHQVRILTSVCSQMKAVSEGFVYPNSGSH